MKIRVLLTRTVEEFCELDVSDYDDARRQIAGLTNDDFLELDSSIHVGVEKLAETASDTAEDITGEIQPHTPNLR